MNSNKRRITMFLAALTLALFLTACDNGGDTPDGDNSTPVVPGTKATENNGTYEGDKDANGKRCGYGVWMYHNFRYEGYWENDMPNGTGTLYEATTPPANREAGHTYINKKIVSSSWVNGFSDGTITLKWVMEDGDVLTWKIETVNGYPSKDGTAYTEDGRTNINYKKDELMGGVPPWANKWTDSSVAPPLANEEPDLMDEPPGEDKTDKPSYTAANVNGNASANLCNRGLAAIQGDWIYFSSNDGNDEDQSKYPASIRVCGKLYAVKTDGTGLRKLTDDKVSYINVVGDWVYYYNESDDGLFKVKIDGTERQKVTDYANSLSVVGDQVSFKNFALYSVNLSGNKEIGSVDQHKISDKTIEEMAVSGDWIYYTVNNEGHALYKVRTDGTDNQIISDEPYTAIQIVGDNIYFQWGGFCVIKTDGSDRREVTEDRDVRPNHYNAAEDIIYFDQLGDNCALYSMNPDGSDVKKICDDSPCYINVAGDWIFYVNGRDLKIYKIKTDGTERQLMP